MNRSIKKFSLVLGLTATLALGGCFKVSHSVPADAPAYVKLYPGAGDAVVIDVAGMKSMTFQANGATPDTVMAYYRTQAGAAQLVESHPATTQTNAAPGQLSSVFGDPSGSQFMVVVARPTAQGTMVNLTYKAPPKAAS